MALCRHHVAILWKPTQLLLRVSLHAGAVFRCRTHSDTTWIQHAWACGSRSLFLVVDASSCCHIFLLLAWSDRKGGGISHQERFALVGAHSNSRRPQILLQLYYSQAVVGLPSP